MCMLYCLVPLNSILLKPCFDSKQHIFEIFNNVLHSLEHRKLPEDSFMQYPYIALFTSIKKQEVLPV